MQSRVPRPIHDPTPLLNLGLLLNRSIGPMRSRRRFRECSQQTSEPDAWVPSTPCFKTYLGFESSSLRFHCPIAGHIEANLHFIRRVWCPHRVVPPWSSPPLLQLSSTCLHLQIRRILEAGTSPWNISISSPNNCEHLCRPTLLRPQFVRRIREEETQKRAEVLLSHGSGLGKPEDTRKQDIFALQQEYPDSVITPVLGTLSLVVAR